MHQSSAVSCTHPPTTHTYDCIQMQYKNDNPDTRDELIKSLRTEIDELKEKNKALSSQIALNKQQHDKPSSFLSIANKNQDLSNYHLLNKLR